VGTLVDTITGISLDGSLGGNIGSAFTALGGHAINPPSGVGQIGAVTPQLALPDTNALFGDGATRIADLAKHGLPSPDAIWSSLTGGLGSMESSLGSGVGGGMTQALQQVRSIGGAAAPDPASLLGGLTGPLNQAIAALTESPELQHVTELVAKVEELRSQLAAAPAELASLLGDQLRAVVDGVAAPVVVEFDHLGRVLTSAEGSLQAQALATAWDGLVARLTPSGGQPVAATIAGLDFADVDAFLAVDAQLRAARLALENIGQSVAGGAADASRLLTAFNADAWAQRLASAAQTAANAEVNDIASVLESLKHGLEQARDFVADLSADHLLQPVHDLVAQVEPLVQSLSFDSLAQTLQQQLSAASEAANTVKQAQLDVLAGIQGIATTIEQAVEGIDLSSVTNAVSNALGEVDAAIEQIDGLIDSVATDLQGGLDSLKGELDVLHTDLTDPAGKFRKPLEDFLGEIRDAVPDDIPQKLEDAGQAVGSAMQGLGGIAFDPVFDEVVDGLHSARDQLKQIDPSTLNSILEAALAAALAVFHAFDFKSEVHDALTKKFDDAVKAVSDPAIEAIQKEVDLILAFIKQNDPATLLNSLGVEDAYKSVVANLESFQPSSLLTDMLRELRDAAAKLDAFTPSAVLAPITAPLAEVKRFVDETLTLDPVFAQLDAALDRLTALLAQIDIAPFLDELESALADVRTRLESMLTTDGLLDGLRPIHQAVMSALAALDPSTLLAPIQNAKQTLVTAVDAVDVSLLSGAFDALVHEIDSFGLDPIRTRFHDRAQQLVSALSAFDLAAKVDQLQTLQHAIHEALDSRGVLPDAVAEDRRQSLLATVDALDPVAVLAPAVTAFRTSQTDAAALAAALDTALASGTALETQLTALVAKLRDMALGVEAGADPKQTLHHAIDTAFGELGLDEITALYTQVHDTFDSYSPEHLQAQLDELLAPVHELIEGLTDPHQLFAEVETAFNDVKGIVDPGLREFVTQLRGDVEAILDAVKAKVEAVDLGAVSSELDARYAEITQLKERLLDKLQSLVDGLDAPYHEVVQIVEDLNPATVLVQPLEETFNAIMAKLGVIDVRKVFQPLLDAIGALRDKLLAQIDRVEQAFEEFLGAAPSGGGGSLAVAA
jgi:hypothetical protein